jgi:hypothetical protein
MIGPTLSYWVIADLAVMWPLAETYLNKKNKKKIRSVKESGLGS